MMSMGGIGLGYSMPPRMNPPQGNMGMTPPPGIMGMNPNLGMMNPLMGNNTRMPPQNYRPPY